MITSEPGSALYKEATETLGHEPRTTVPEGGGDPVPSGEDMVALQRDLIMPALETEMATEDFQTEMGDARHFLKITADGARANGVMVFQAAGNGYMFADAAGNPELSEGALSNVDGIFRVGATVPNGPGADDDGLAPFSAEGPVDASAQGMFVPVGTKDGKAYDLAGTSFSSPIMTETAYVMSGANPDLSLQQIEDLLEDPRVARDVEGAYRDGAGAVDQVAAVLLARNPNLSRSQLNDIRATLDANPDANFTLQPDGSLVRAE